MRIIVGFDTDGTSTANIVGPTGHDANVRILTIDVRVEQKSV